MKGLVIKDLMCLRKQLILFGFTVASVMVLAVMFVLSVRFGNIGKMVEDMLATKPDFNFTQKDINNMAILSLLTFMFLPIACVGDFANVFEADGKAGFAKVSAFLPISIERRVLAKYITILMMFGIGVGVDLAITAVLSAVTDLVSFWDYSKSLLTAASVMSIYGAIEIVFCFLFGHGKEDYARMAAFISLVSAVILLNLKKIKVLLTSSEFYPYDGMVRFLENKCYLFCLTAVLVMSASYVASVSIAKRKRGIV